MADANPSLHDLKLKPAILGSLKAQGFRHLDDLRSLTNLQLLLIPNMGGSSYKRILAALGRKPDVGGPMWKRRER